MDMIFHKPLKFVFVPTGTYRSQHFRPLKTTVDELIIKKMFERTDYGKNFSPTVLAGLASTILSPSTIPTGEAKIPHGWGSQRYRFVLILEITSANQSFTQVATGYTDHMGLMGVSKNHLDDNMNLYFNSFQTFTSTLQMTPKGPKKLLIPYDLSQLVRNEVKTGLGTFKYDHMNPYLEQQLMRPQDIFNFLTLSMLSNGDDSIVGGLNLSYKNNSKRSNMPYEDTLDTRTVSAGNFKTSNRKNGNATTYLSSLLTSLKSSKKAFADTNPCKVYLEASGHKELRDKDPSSNLTIQKISTFYPEFSKKGSVTLKHLKNVIPDLPKVTTVVRFGKAKSVRKLADVSDSENMGSSTRGAHAAAVLHSSLPELMVDSLLGQVTFMASNNYPDGRIKFTWTDETSVKSLCEGIEPYVHKFTYRLTNEFLYEMSNQGATRFDLFVFADIFGDINIKVGFDGATPEPYIIPSFADSLFASVIGDNGDDLKALAGDMESLAVNICDTN